MNSYISMFEIPATDVTRAVRFYEGILGISIEVIDMEEMKMGIFPYENQTVNVVIIEAEGVLPSQHGVTVYFNAGEDLKTVLDKVERLGGKIVVRKTPHADESGYFAIFYDSEGNKMALHSPG